MQTTDTGKAILIDLTDDTDLFSAFRLCCTTFNDRRRHSAAIEAFAGELNARAVCIMGDAAPKGVPALDLHADAELWQAFIRSVRAYPAFSRTGDDTVLSKASDAFDSLLIARGQMIADHVAQGRRSLAA